MNSTFTYDFTRKAIIGTKTNIRKANLGLKPQYTELTKMLKEHPTFDVVEKTIKQKENKKTYHGLTIPVC